MTLPDFSFERTALARGARRVAGVDEVGRGPLAGPVTAAAVVLEPDNLPDGLNDSKKLTAKRREALAEWLAANCDHCIIHVGVEEIDRLNIYHASHLAMCMAVAGLKTAPCHVLVDGNRVPRDLSCPGEAIVGGDARCVTIAAASILAKVARDRLMVDLAQQHPGYGWEANAGYATPAHKQALLDLGVTPYHRRSFEPVHNILCKALEASS
jgi:ribonuclease HII